MATVLSSASGAAAATLTPIDANATVRPYCVPSAPLPSQCCPGPCDTCPRTNKVFYQVGQVQPAQAQLTYHPAYYRRSLNAGHYELSMALNAKPDPRLYNSSLTELTKVYAKQLREFGHLKDPNLRRC